MSLSPSNLVSCLFLCLLTSPELFKEASNMASFFHKWLVFAKTLVLTVKVHIDGMRNLSGILGSIFLLYSRQNTLFSVHKILYSIHANVSRGF